MSGYVPKNLSIAWEVGLKFKRSAPSASSSNKSKFPCRRPTNLAVDAWGGAIAPWRGLADALSAIVAYCLLGISLNSNPSCKSPLFKNSALRVALAEPDLKVFKPCCIPSLILAVAKELIASPILVAPTPLPTLTPV